MTLKPKHNRPNGSTLNHQDQNESMKGRRFATIEEIKTESLRELKDIPKSAYQKCFEDWKKRWHKCIVSEGGYFEGDNIEIYE